MMDDFGNDLTIVIMKHRSSVWRGIVATGMCFIYDDFNLFAYYMELLS